MCWFNKKKKEENKKEIEFLKQELITLRTEFDMFRTMTESKLQFCQEHIENDKDTKQGDDEVTWGETFNN